MTCEALLESGLRHFNMPLALMPKFLTYLDLLCRWNQAFNLTALRDKEEMVSKHLLDSLAIDTFIKPTRIIDVGTGAGLPGIPLAILHPTWQFTLVDSNGKKMRFLHEVKRVLQLENVSLIKTRVEAFEDKEGFDTVMSRAFSSLSEMIKWTLHLVKEDGLWLAMKGKIPEAELKELKYPYVVETYTVPTLIGERCSVLINRKK